MEINLKGKRMAYFLKNPAIMAAAIFVLVTLAIIIGMNRKSVVIEDGNTVMKVATFKKSVEDVLKQEKITLGSKDKIFPELESVIADGTKISIKRAVPVTVAISGEKLEVLSAEDTVGEMLAAEGITYDEKDKVYPGVQAVLSKDMEVRIVKVTEEEIIEKETIEYTKEIKKMPEWEVGVSKKLRDGSNGEITRTIKITYEDGVEKKREVISEEITKEPVSELTALGTINTRVLSRGETIKFKKMLVMKATSYTDDIASTGKDGGNTATGTKPRRIPGGGKWSTVAVDPKVIPLGTKLWVEEYGYAIAEDVGGAVKGNIIDLFFTRDSQEYLDWYTHKVKVYILE